MVNEKGNVRLMQRINRARVLEYIRRNKAVSRYDIADNTALSLSSVTNIVTFLHSRGYIRQAGRQTMVGAGRRATLLEFDAEAMHIVCVNIEPEGFTVAVTDLEGNIKDSTLRRINSDDTPDDVINSIKQCTKMLAERDGRVCAIGVAVSGHVTNGSGIVSSSIMCWKSVNVKDKLREEFEIPVYVTNNTKTKALCHIEDCGEENVVFLDLMRGVGIVRFFEGKLSESVTGELGHTTVMKDGPACFCGNRGCLERVCSEDYVLNQYGGDFDTLIRAEDEAARLVLRRCAEYLGIGIANIISIFEPGMIIINGNRLTACDFFYRTALDEARVRGYNLMFREVAFRHVSTSEAQAIAGVGKYVTERLFSVTGPEEII